MKEIPSTFTRYELTEQETQAGSYFSTAQRWVLQNMLSDIADEKLNMVFDPNNPADFSQQIAYKQGQIDLIRSLFVMHDQAVASTTSQNQQE